MPALTGSIKKQRVCYMLRLLRVLQGRLFHPTKTSWILRTKDWNWNWDIPGISVNSDTIWDLIYPLTAIGLIISMGSTARISREGNLVQTALLISPGVWWDDLFPASMVMCIKSCSRMRRRLPTMQTNRASALRLLTE